MKEPENISPLVGRREFCKKLGAACIGGAVGLVPVAAGLTMFMDPLRRQSLAQGSIYVTTLEALPADGVPRKFPVLANKVDAWNKFSQVPIGAVYLRRPVGEKVEALNVVCPHAGCFVDFVPDRMMYLCPCHKATYNLEGQIADRSGPAPRGMDTLDVELRNGREVWVKFQNYQAGHAEKIPMA